MGLATPQVQQMITVGDEGGSIGRLKQQFEIDGAPAVKLHVGLDTPVIIMPRSSSSQEYVPPVMRTIPCVCDLQSEEYLVGSHVSFLFN